MPALGSREQVRSAAPQLRSSAHRHGSHRSSILPAKGDLERAFSQKGASASGKALTEGKRPQRVFLMDAHIHKIHAAS